MKNSDKFFICKHCGNLIGFIKNQGVPIICCGEKMELLAANTVDAAVEKHLPVIKKGTNEITVTVGEVEHPMTDAHFIEFIYVLTEKGGQKKMLCSTDAPIAKFAFADDAPISVYAYCNLHGLWKTDV